MTEEAQLQVRATIAPIGVLEATVAEFRCRQCGVNMQVQHSGGVAATQGLAECASCHQWTPFRETGNIFGLPETLSPARVCPSCKTKAAFKRLWDWPPDGEPVSALDMCTSCGSVSYFRGNRSGQRIDDQYPKVTAVPADEVPDGVKKAFAEALICYGAGAPNGALLMCRRAIQEALDEQEAIKGDLPTQLGDLVSKQKITPDLRDWADHARIGGKLAGHGTGGKEWGDPTRIWGNTSDAAAVIEFCEAFFEYLYVLPERNKQRRERTGIQPVAQLGPGSNAS